MTNTITKAITFSLLAASLFTGCNSPSPEADRIVPLPSPADSPSAEPYLFTSPAGETYLSWIEKSEGSSALKFSQLIDTAWSEPRLVGQGDKWFVNWADYPMIASNDDSFLALYLEKSGDGKYTYDVKLTYSQDATAWSPSGTLNGDGKQAEHGFVSVQPYGDDFFVAWLDGRNTTMEGHDDHMGSMSLRAAIVTSNGEKKDEWELDDRTCDCCQTDVAITTNGPVAVYRDRSEDEIRDMSIVRLINGQWTKPASIHADNWKIAGCPVNGPRISAWGDDVAVAWFTAPGDKPQVSVAFSSNGGETFHAPVRVDEGHPVGRVDIILDEGMAWVSWMEGSTIKLVSVSRDGTKGSPVTIAKSSDARSSGFPQMTRSGNRIIFAWTDDQAKTVMTGFLPI